MVYCGKPSKGCSNCRERKIRCDQRQLGCGQCEKRQQHCPGYRNLVDLMFRDESSHVIKKAKAKARRKNGGSPTTLSPPEPDLEPTSAPTTPGTYTFISAGPPFARTPEPEPIPVHLAVSRPPSVRTPEPAALLTPKQPLLSILTPTSQDNWQAPPDDSLLPSPDSDEWPRLPQVALPYHLPPCYQEQGTAFFFSQFVSVEESNCHHKFDFVYDIWKPASMLPEKQVDGVMASMTAVGLAGLSQMTKSDELLELSRKSYGTALRLTNLALKKPAEAVKDTTMLAILILGMYEMVVGSQKPLQAWHEHINGAATLAKLRGPDQFKTEAGVKMFLMLNHSVVLSCIQRAVPMPKSLLELRKHMARFMPREDAPWTTIDASTAGIENGPYGTFNSEPIYPISRLMQLRSDLVSGQLADPEAIVDQLAAVESEFEDWFAEFPEMWRYRVVRLKNENSAVFKGQCYLYTSTKYANFWNGIRYCRWLVLEMLRSELVKGFQANPPRFASPAYLRMFYKTDVLLKKLRDAVVASVPYSLGIVNESQSNSQVVSIPTVVAVQEPPNRVGVSSPRSSVSSSSGSRPSSPNDEFPHHVGATLLDPTASRHCPEDGEARFHMLASANNVMIIPLYFVGMSAICTPEVRKYVVERLDAIWRESGMEQAQMAASIIEDQELSNIWKVKFPTSEMANLASIIQREQEFACSSLLL